VSGRASSSSRGPPGSPGWCGRCRSPRWSAPWPGWPSPSGAGAPAPPASRPTTTGCWSSGPATPAHRVLGWESGREAARFRDRNRRAGGGARLPAPLARRPRPRAGGRRPRPGRLRGAEGGLHGAGGGRAPGHRPWRRPRRPGQRASGSIRAPGPSAQVARARQLMGQGRFLDALKAYDAALAKDPGQPEALTYRGWLIRLTGKADNNTALIDRGLASIEKAIAADADYPDAHLFRGIILFEDKGNAAAAVPELELY